MVLILDSSFCLSIHIQLNCNSCQLYLQITTQIHPLFPSSTIVTPAQVTIISHLDYCNSFLTGLPTSTLSWSSLYTAVNSFLKINQMSLPYLKSPKVSPLYWESTLSSLFCLQVLHKIGPDHLLQACPSHAPVGHTPPERPLFTISNALSFALT